MSNSVVTPLNLNQPFSRADARAAGFGKRALLSGSFTKIGFDCYVSSRARVDLAMRARAALDLCPPGSHVSHHTAARLWGAVVPPTSAVHIWQPSANGRTVRQGIKAHYGGSNPQEVTVSAGLPVSTPEQAFAELAQVGTELVELVVAGDSLVKAKATTPARLVAAVARLSGRGSQLALRAARLVRAGVDSPMETRLRLLLVLAGLPEPEVNLILRSRDGAWTRRFELCYRDYRLIVEYDGRHHADDAQQWDSDIHRREELERDGWRLIIITSRGIYQNPLDTLERVRTALLDRGAIGIPRRLRPQWRMHFAS